MSGGVLPGDLALVVVAWAAVLVGQVRVQLLASVEPGCRYI